jgi:hypothetical protein
MIDAGYQGSGGVARLQPGNVGLLALATEARRARNQNPVLPRRSAIREVGELNPLLGK